MKKPLILFFIILWAAYTQNCPDNCLQCDQTKTTPSKYNPCISCYPFFYINSAGGCGLYTPLAGCKIYNVANPSLCSECQSRYMLYQGRCLFLPQNCVEVDRLSECIKCEAGYVNSRGKCYSTKLTDCPLGSLPVNEGGIQYCWPLTLINCKLTGPNGFCDECATGYENVNGLCFKLKKPAESCIGCNCEGGAVINNKCYYIDIEGCNVYGQLPYPNYCQACRTDLTPVRGTCVNPVKLDDINCNAESNGLCTGCNQNFDLNRNAYCVKSFNFDFSKEQCEANDQLEYYQTKCFLKDQNCGQISISGSTITCLWCRESFSLQNGRCVRNACVKYDATRARCLQAFNGYSIVNSNLIIRNPGNCLNYDVASSSCLRCSVYTQFTPRSIDVPINLTKICAYYNQNCITYSDVGICQKCQAGYSIINRQCIKNADNCLKLVSESDLTKCKDCIPGYRLQTTNGYCYLQQQGCLIYQFGSRCRECQSLYFLNDGQCYFQSAFDQNCERFTVGGQCQRCKNGFLPYNNRCVYYSPYCLSYGGDGKCNRAMSGFSLGNFNQNDQQNYKNFIAAGYSATSGSSQVSFSGGTGGGSASGGSSSGGSSSGGSSASGSGSGSGGGGAYQQGGVILSVPYSGVQSSRIKSWNLQGKITECISPYTLVKNKCVKQISNCQQYNFQGNCILCSPSYSMNSLFQCQFGSNCAQNRNIDGRCTECSAGYTLIDNFCVANQNQADIDNLVAQSKYFRYGSIAWYKFENCERQIAPHRCSICSVGFSLNSDGKCVVQTNNCAQYSRSGLCQSCQTGYILWSGSCKLRACTNVKPNGYCQACPANLYYNFGFCISSNRDKCTFYSNGQCIQCEYGYYLSSAGVCLPEINKCLTTNPDTGRCLVCKSGNTIYQDQCYKQTQYCLDYNRSQVCVACASSTFLKSQLVNDNTCVRLQGQCSSVDLQTKLCNKCNSGYDIYNQNSTKLCVSLRPNCQLYGTSGKCTQCVRRYVLQNNFCRLYINGCIKHNQIKGTCEQCRQNTILSDNDRCCIEPDNKCLQYEECNCIKCPDGYYLNENKICVLNPNNCLDYVPAIGCRLCVQGYYLDANGLCIERSIIQNGCESGYNVTIETTLRKRNWYNCVRCKKGFERKQADGLCYAFNCQPRNSLWRYCQNCPVYYKIFVNTVVTENYCIPFFCDDYNLNRVVCADGSSIRGAYIELPNTIKLRYCTTTNTNGSCRICENYRYPNKNTQYFQCYPYNCRNSAQFDCSECSPGFVKDPRYQGSCIAQYCLDYKPDGSCRVCQSPYNLTGSGTCQNLGCCEVYTVFGGCELAKKYYIVESGVCGPNNCATKNPIDPIKCQICKQGFYNTNNGICRPLRCKTQTSTGSGCISCQDGYIVLGRICVPIGCKKYDSKFICTQCQQGYYQENGLCRVRNCKREVAYKCQQCNKYFKLNKDICNPANCSSILNYERCQCCDFLFALNPATKLCQPNQEFCIKSNVITGACEACQIGFKLLSGKCVNEVKNCRTYDLIGCSQCIPGYEKGTCGCQPKYCKTFGSDGLCSECGTRYEKIRGLCKPRDCLIFNQDQWRCYQCYERFQYINEACASNNCQVFDDPNRTICKICQFVSGNSRIVNGTIIESVYLMQWFGGCYIRGCIVDPRNLFCQSCSQGYRRTLDGYCQCINFDLATGECICPASTIRQENGTCFKDPDPCLIKRPPICVQCPGQYQNIQGKCTIPDCQQMNYVTYKCDKCKKFFNKNERGFCKYNLCTKFAYVNGYVFEQCQSCVDGYDPIDTYCVPRKCNISTYNVYEQTCGECSDLGYVLTSDSRRCIPANCKDQNIPCKNCLDGFYPLGEICLSRYCVIFVGVDCHQCRKGFSKTPAGNCEADNCLKFDSSRNCTACKGNFVLADQACMNCQIGFYKNDPTSECLPYRCESFLQNKTQCLNCLPGYYKENGTCIDINCKFNRFTNQFECLECKQYFDFNGLKICDFKNKDFCGPGKFFSYITFGCETIGGNCMYVNNNVCIQCLPGYFLFNNLCYSLAGCSKYSYYFGCWDCLPGFRLQNNQCIKTNIIPNCKIYDASQTRCLGCIEGYAVQDGSCYSIIQFCSVYSSVTRLCQTCVNGYEVINGLCVIIKPEVDPNCLQYNLSTNLCLQCKPRFELINNMCYARFCLSYTQSSRLCTTCINGYKAFNGLCYKEIIGCSAYNPDSEQCLSCIDGYILQNGLCYKEISGCKAYNLSNPQICQTCIDGYVLQDGLCYKEIARCRVYNPVTRFCQVCISGYEVSNGLCVEVKPEVDPNCLQYNLSTNICLQCKPRFELINNLCYARFCLSYIQSSRLCTTCINGYKAFNGLCYKEIIGCNAYNPDSQLCLRCIDGYTLQNGLCYKEMSGCSVYNPSNPQICQTCINGYVLQDGLCYKEIIRCRVYNPATSLCQACISGYEVSNGICVAIKPEVDPNCLQYNLSTNICLQCKPRFELINNLCYARFCLSYTQGSRLCTTCINGYKAFNGLCYKEIIGCNTYNPDSQLCLTCIAGYTLQNGLCYKEIIGCRVYNSSTPQNCQTCIDGYVLQDGLCYKEIARCRVYNPATSFCQICNDGFILQGGLCYAIIPNCARYLPNSSCEQCIDNFYLQNGKCVSRQIDPNCQIYDPKTYLCTQCVSGFSLRNNICIPNFCDIFSGGFCRTCISGYVLYNNLCFKIINGCSSYNSTNGLCAICENIYVLQDYYCYKTINNCRIYNTNSTCRECLPNYILQDNICYLIIPYCVFYNVNNGLCASCANGYQLSNGRCVQKNQIVGCITYTSDNTRCLRCANAYVLLNGYCYSKIDRCQDYALDGRCARCEPGYDVQNNGYLCSRITFPSCFYPGQVSCSICLFRYYLSSQQCLPYPKYCTNVNPLNGSCISCCFGSRLSNGVCVKQSSPFCVMRNGVCGSCVQGYKYCQYCEMCVPAVDPNCKNQTLAFSQGRCNQCAQGYFLAGDGKCASKGVGYISGTSNKCYDGFVQENDRCVVNENELGLQAKSTVTTLSTSSDALINRPVNTVTTTKTPTTITTYGFQMVIFGMEFRSSAPSQEVVIYFKNSDSSPLVCWNSCLSLKITSNLQKISLNFPIVASQIRVYLLQGNANNLDVTYLLLR